MDRHGPLRDPEREPNRTAPPTAPWRAEPVTVPATSRARRPRRSWAWRWTRRIAAALALLVVGVLALIVVYRFAMPAWTPTMVARHLTGEPVNQRWIPLHRVSPLLIRAVLTSEDARFCTHAGIDLGELKAAIEEAKSGASPRGASTITMQVVKNVFLWPGRSYVRKAIELPLALVVDAIWPKRRILEVYLNIAEWGPGIYGIDAAASDAFAKSPSTLTAREAARLAVVLPNPLERDPANLEPRIARVSQIIGARMRGGVNTSCLD
jgi:monofunctional glycosyltransferase